MRPSTPAATNCLEALIAYKQNPSTEGRNKLVRLNAGLVRKVAHRILQQCNEPYEDLEQIGYLGLIRAIERFDPTQGCAFSSFAVPYIRGDMLHYLRDRSGTVKIPRRWQDLQKEAQKLQPQLQRVLGRTADETELAQALGVPVSEWQEAKFSNKNRHLLSLDARVGGQDDSAITLGETLPDANYQVMQKLEEDRAQLQRAMQGLEEGTRTVIEFVFYNGLSRKEVAKKIGVSPMTVSRRLQEGLQQMASCLGAAKA
ncbi:RNA polymerase sigma factor SigF [Pseudanabaena sp. FACHB-2040]|uniref:RNA polymerase sigma factor SigF n=1 Tax=Pseudanabaena sp. FACHB-2040 TaxID=2692859 RepID=UPI0016877102|nr:RNA polymerase sigma factor SigF [Pseudanabaena sp. FACHB-2040]MBD2261390.1 RNA polymerase sigma factor SigF [Pseudanabaena sp. FACHB-2040]